VGYTSGHIDVLDALQSYRWAAVCPPAETHAAKDGPPLYTLNPENIPELKR